MPVLDAFYRKHRAQGLAMLAVSIDDGASNAKLQQVTSGFAFSIARVDDVKMPRRDIPASIPVTRVYDRSGRLVFESKADGNTTLQATTLDRAVTPQLEADQVLAQLNSGGDPGRRAQGADDRPALRRRPIDRAGAV